MIAFNFDYYKPDTVEGALRKFVESSSGGKTVLYYGGGTEIVSFARKNDILVDAVIDIKGIPECNVFGVRGEELVVGAALTLTSISESRIFPLFSDTSRFAADHTIRNKITLGGNICGRIIYREAVLALLVSDSTAVIAGKEGIRFEAINEAFNKRLQLDKGEFLVQVRIPREFFNLPHVAVKKTKISRVGYPIVSAAAIKKDEKIRIALSGALPYPFRSKEVEEALNDRRFPVEVRVENAVKSFPDKIMGGVTASPGYREFVTKNTLISIINSLEA